MADTLLELSHVSQRYRTASGEDNAPTLDDISLRLDEGEIVGLLGRSGCGKSTLLRIVSGLVHPSQGRVFFRGEEVSGPVDGIAMVFQSFALFPWLSVQENVEFGLRAAGINGEEAQKRALAAIQLIGLRGFESAYPKELSGGMRQRVGFARALVVNPTILLMDEPFSALDVLTAETLRTDLLELWVEGRMPIKSILMVTHNIEEAVLMCDRIVVLSSNPGRIAADIKVPLQHPRLRLDPDFRHLVDMIYGLMTKTPDHPAAGDGNVIRLGIGMVLPRVSTNLMSGLLEAVAGAPFHGKADLPDIASSLHLKVDALFPVAETLQLLRFAEVEAGDIALTQAGMKFAGADVETRKSLFADHLVTYVPLAARIRQVLAERPKHRAPAARFREELEDYMDDDCAETTLRAVTAWGRYGEVFAYDEHAAVFSLDRKG